MPEFDLHMVGIVSDDGETWYFSRGEVLHDDNLQNVIKYLSLDWEVPIDEIEHRAIWMRPADDSERGKGAMDYCRENDPEAKAYWAVGYVPPFDLEGSAIERAYSALVHARDYIAANGDKDSAVGHKCEKALEAIASVRPRGA